MQIKISTESLDSLSPECLVLGLFSDERPPRGPCGFADWRLNGLISNLMASGRITGAPRENVMIDTCRRIPPPKLILHGLGPFADLTCETLYEAGLHLAATLSGLRCPDFAFDVPAASRSALDVTQMTEALIRGFFDRLLSENTDSPDIPCPCVVVDESYFQKALLGLHKYKLSMRDRRPVDIIIKRLGPSSPMK